MPDLPPAIEKLCAKHFDYFPDALNERYDALQHTRELISHYLEVSSSLSEELRCEIKELSIKSDFLSLSFDELYVTASDFITGAKQKYFFGKIPAPNKQKTHAFHEKLRKNSEELTELIEQTKKYVRRVRAFCTPRSRPEL